jgi:predicted Zn finger-like uncharacterized protein
MSNERVAKYPVECPHCKTKQVVHVAASGAAQVGRQTIQCIGCDHHFVVPFTDKIVGGPFPA